jgi:acetylornithine deacetylase
LHIFSVLQKFIIVFNIGFNRNNFFKSREERYKFNNRIKEDNNNAFELPYTTFNLGKIQGGVSLNRVPGECSCYLEYRTIRPDHNRQIIEKITELAEKYNGFVTIIDDVPPMSTFAESFISELENLTGNQRSSIAVVSDGNYLGENAVVLLGPGPITSGEKNEFVSKFSYETLIELYTKLLKETCF